MMESPGDRGAMDQVLSKLLSEVSRVYKENNTLTDDILSALHFTMGPGLQQALDLVDRRCVSKLVSPSGRQLYQVLGSSGTPYTCYTALNYCSCPAYRFTVLKKEESTMCKHLMAIHLSESMGVCTTQEVSDQHLTTAIQLID